MAKEQLRLTRIENINLLYQIDIGVPLEFLTLTNSVTDLLDKLDIIDELIKSKLKNYVIERLSYYDRAIIRFAVYEMKYLKLPPAIAINEAIEITKEFTNLDDEKQHKFNHRLLDDISKDF